MLEGGCPDREPDANARALLDALGARSLVLVGMMGAGKSSIGRRLANRLGLPFADADTEIEAAAGMSIPEIFARHGEPAFRSGEARVISRLLDKGPQVLATGGGAVMNEGTRDAIRTKAVSIWLKAEPDVLMRRIKRRNDRPLLKTDDPAATLKSLLAVREPTYSQADLVIESREGPHSAVVDDIVANLSRMLTVAPSDTGTAAGGAR
jgi:shikimate kinase